MRFGSASKEIIRRQESLVSVSFAEIGYPHPGGQGQVESHDSSDFARRPLFLAQITVRP